MSEENKCVGLDCAICAETKCPNEKTIINGIDVSECPLFDKKTGCYHTFNGECAKNSCALYKWLLEHKRLQEENKRLQMLSCVNCGEKYLSPDGAELYEKNVQLQKENDELKKRQVTKNGFICDCEQNVKYKQALEEIREILMCKFYGLNENASQLDYMCYVLDKFKKIRIKILTKINEVLKQ